MLENKKDDRGVPNPQIVEEIKRLYEKIDFDYLGTSAIEIASELISIDIDLSVTLLEKSFNLEKDESSMDKIMLILLCLSLLKILKEEMMT